MKNNCQKNQGGASSALVFLCGDVAQFHKSGVADL